MTLKRRLLTHRDTHIKGGDDAFLTTDEIIHRLENLSADPTPSTDTIGRIFYNTAEDLVKYDNGSAIRAIGEGLGKRSATRIVAASNALQSSKDGADYVCDGSDDQVEIQQALDEIVNSAQDPFVYLSEGDFYLSDSINIYDRTLLLGSGFATRLNAGAGVNLISTTANAATHSTVSNIRFATGGVGIYIDAGYNTVRNCLFETDIGVNCDWGTSKYNTVADCIFKNSPLRVENSANFISVLGNVFYSAPIIFDGSVGTLENCIIENNAIDGDASVSVGISLDNTTRAVVSGNVIYKCLDNGIYVYDDSFDLVVSGNYVYFGYVTGDRIGIHIADSMYCVVNSNKATDGSYGILEDGTSDYNVIIGNNLIANSTPLSTVGVNSEVAHNLV